MIENQKSMGETMIGQWKKKGIFVAAGVLVCSIWCADLSPAAQVDPSSEEEQEEEANGAAWDKDMSDKMDKAIKVLGVVRDEMDKSEEAAGAKASGSSDPKEDAWGDQVKGRTSLAVRMWRKIMGIVRPKEEGAGKGSDEDVDWTEDAEKNVDKIVDVSEKVQKIVASYTSGGNNADSDLGSKSMKEKIDKAMKVLAVIKEELDKDEKDAAAKGK